MEPKSGDIRFLSVERVAQIVATTGVAPALAALADCIETDFRRWGDFEKSARLASHSPVGVIELMPVADATRYAFKYVNGHPENHRHALPTVMAFGVLAEVATGLPLLVSELTLTTALRTAATSAVAARVLARSNARIMALIGNGAQSEFQAIAFQHLLGIDTVHLHDVDAAATAKLARHLQRAGLKVRCFSSTADAVRGVDIVTTATADKRNATILQPEMIEAGMHINAIGGDCPGKTELHAQILHGARVCVEYTPQTRIEGEIQQMRDDFPVVELWEVLTGREPGRRHADEVTVFDSVGFALEDYSALRFLYERAQALGIDDRIGLIPVLPDPKDLYRLVTTEGLPLERVA